MVHNGGVRPDGESSDEIDWLDLDPADEPATSSPHRLPWPRWFTLAVVAAVVLAFGLAALKHQRHVRSAVPITIPSRSPVSTSPTAPTPAATMTTAVPLLPVVSVTRVGHPLLGATSGWELFGRGDGFLLRIQLAAGRITRTTIPSMQESGSMFVLADPDQVIIRPLEGAPGYLVPDGKPARDIGQLLRLYGPVFPGPAPDQVWISSDDQREMVLTNSAGARLPASIPIPQGSTAFDATSDGAGYLLFSSVGGVYEARPAGLRRITTGALLAVGPTAWLVDECDERYRCQMVLIGRMDGSRRIVDAGLTTFDRRGVISPDGSTAALLTTDPDGRSGLYLLDLASGKRRVVAISIKQEAFTGGVSFSPDSAWLFAVAENGSLAVINRRSGAVGTLGTPLPVLDQVVLRPAR